MSVLGWWAVWGVGINMCIHPNNFCVWVGFKATRNRSDSLRVVSSKNNREVAFTKGPFCRRLEHQAAEINILHVLSIQFLKLLWSKIEKFFKLVMPTIADSCLLRNWNFLITNILHIFEPTLLVQPPWRELNSAFRLSTGKRVSDDLDLSDLL